MKQQCSDCKKVFFNKKSFSNHTRFGCPTTHSRPSDNVDYLHNKCMCGNKKGKYSSKCLTCYLLILVEINRKKSLKHYFNCINCNKKIMVKNFRIKQFKHHFCSKKCFYIWRKENFKGIGNPNHKHGLSRFPYPMEFNESLKEKIRIRDNYICQICYKKGNSIHHIDYNKFNCKENNLINLCRDCNSKVNANRDYWYSYFIYKMEVHH